LPDSERVRTGREGGLTSWANTTAAGERHQRMAAVRANSPASDDYWMQRLGHDPAALTAEQRTALAPNVATLKKLYFARLRKTSVAKAKRAKAERLQKQADAIDAELAADA
jgi:hypothetical protein